MSVIRTKRIYEPADPSDGFRLLVMRRWPRGIRKDRVDAWEKELAPSLGLLNQIHSGHIPSEVFLQAYLDEIQGKEDLLEWARSLAGDGALTLLCSCKDEGHCHRTSLQRVLQEGSGLRPYLRP